VGAEICEPLPEEAGERRFAGLVGIRAVVRVHRWNADEMLAKSDQIGGHGSEKRKKQRNRKAKKSGWRTNGIDAGGWEELAIGMPPRTVMQIMALVLRVCLGAYFTYSGGVKIFVTGLTKFTEAIGNYRIVGAPWDAVAAYAVPWLEIVAGVCLMLGVLRRGALLVVGGLVCVFSGAVGYAWSHNLNIACGCQGGDQPMDYRWKALELGILAMVVAFLWFAERKRLAESR